MNRHPMIGGFPDSSQTANPTPYEALPSGNPDDGEHVFSGAGCSACHSLNPDERIIGPSLAGIGSRAASTRPDYSAEFYIFESISDPDAYVVAGFLGNLMPPNYNGQLDSQQIADLIAFLMTR